MGRKQKQNRASAFGLDGLAHRGRDESLFEASLHAQGQISRQDDVERIPDPSTRQSKDPAKGTAQETGEQDGFPSQQKRRRVQKGEDPS